MRRRRWIGVCLAILVCGLAAGCWDQRYLKDLKLIQGVGVDATEDGYELTVSIQKSEEQKSPEQVPVLSAKGHTIREIRMKMTRHVSGQIDTSSNRIILIHKDVARQDIYAPMDVFYRDPHNPLTARLAVSDLKTKQLLNMKVSDEPFIGDYIYKIVMTSEQHGYVPKTSVQHFCSDIFGAGEDGALPLVGVNTEEKVPKVTGVALFRGRQMTGTLMADEGLMLNMLADHRVQGANMTMKAFDDGVLPSMNYVTISIDKVKRKLEFTRLDPVEAKLTLEIDAAVVEKPDAEVTVKEEVEKLQVALGEQLTKLAEQVIGKLQKAESDVLQLGKTLKAKHYDTSRQMDWRSEYKEAKITADVRVRITGSGIIE